MEETQGTLPDPWPRDHCILYMFIWFMVYNGYKVILTEFDMMYRWSSCWLSYKQQRPEVKCFSNQGSY